MIHSVISPIFNNISVAIDCVRVQQYCFEWYSKRSTKFALCVFQIVQHQTGISAKATQRVFRTMLNVMVISIVRLMMTKINAKISCLIMK